MSQVKDLFKKALGKNGYYERYKPKKLTVDILELKDNNYELVYDSIDELYSLFFEVDGNMYCLETPEAFINESNYIFLYNIENGKFKNINWNFLGNEIFNLCIRFKEIILNHSIERIKLLMNKK